MPSLNVSQIADTLKRSKPVYTDFSKRLGGAALSAYTSAHEAWLEVLRQMTLALLVEDEDLDVSAFIADSGGAYS